MARPAIPTAKVEQQQPHETVVPQETQSKTLEFWIIGSGKYHCPAGVSNFPVGRAMDQGGMLMVQVFFQ